MKRYFITGTDTDCGKTYVTRKFIEVIDSAVAIKPLASGCIQTEEGLVSEDAVQLLHNNALSLAQINPWRYQQAVSPHIAARVQGQEISVQELADYCMQFNAPGYDTLLIEGAGGLIVPLSEKHTWLDFLKITNIPVILVVGMKLGCINHSLLTQTALTAYGIDCAGWVANCMDQNMQCISENLQTLQNKLTSPLLGVIEYGKGFQNQPGLG